MVLKRNLLLSLVLTLIPILISTACVTNKNSTIGLAEEDTLVQLDGKNIKVSDLPPDLREKLYQAEKNYFADVVRIARRATVETYVKDEAAIVHKPEEQVARDLGLQKNQLFAANDDDSSHLISQYTHDAQYTNAINRIATRRKLSFAIDNPVPPTHQIDVSGFPVANPETTVVDHVLVEFFDYRCGHCQHKEDQIQNLIKSSPNLRVVAIDFLLIDDPSSKFLSKGSYCSQNFGQYPFYRKSMFSQARVQHNLNAKEVVTAMPIPGVTSVQWQQCLQSADASNYVDRALKLAKGLTINQTPTMFLDGRRVDSPEAVKTALNLDMPKTAKF